MQGSPKQYLTAEQIKKEIERIGREISNDHKGREITMLGVLKGSLIFLSDLLRNISLEVRVGFVRIEISESTTPPTITFIYPVDLKGRDVIIVEDIVDTGITLNFLLDHIREQNPSSLEACVMLDKTEARKEEVEVKYRGFIVPTAFFVGYGMDYQEGLRNLPYIAIMEGE